MSVADNFEFGLKGLDRGEWITRVEAICDDCGTCQPLGPNFTALQVDRGDKLIVCFETVASIRKLNAEEAPLGWLMSRGNGWSSLTIIAQEGESWFRDPALYAYFDRLIDDGYFDEFETVLFYGAGGAGYAAAAYSVAAPEAHVLALRPQATLAPEIARWDRRHLPQRRHDFVSRFGYAPMMLETAARAWVIYDPIIPEDAMHAQLFKADNTVLLRTPHLGDAIERDFISMEILTDLIEEAMDGTLDARGFAELWRERRDHMPYLRALFHALDDAERPGLLGRLCRFVTAEGNRPMFARKLAELEAQRQSAPETEDA